MTFEAKDVAGKLWEKFSVGSKNLIGLPSKRYGRVVLRREIRRQVSVTSLSKELLSTKTEAGL